jgi:hypothetical protein
MNMKILFLTSLYLILTSAVQPCHAISIDYQNLPYFLRNDAQNVGNNFTIGNTLITSSNQFSSVVDTPGFSIFQLSRSTTTTGIADPKWLIRYALDPISSESLTFLLSDTYLTVNTTVQGHVWLEAPTVITANNSNQFGFYPGNVNTDWIGINRPPISHDLDVPVVLMDMTVDAANSGSAYYEQNEPSRNFPLIRSTNLSSFNRVGFGSDPYYCSSCGKDLVINLLGLAYDKTGRSSINTKDARTTLLSFSEYAYRSSDSFALSQNLSIQPVPLPSSVFLFASGLLLLIRRKPCRAR